jgi:hypothetical protein
LFLQRLIAPLERVRANRSRLSWNPIAREAICDGQSGRSTMPFRTHQPGLLMRSDASRRDDDLQ